MQQLQRQTEAVHAALYTTNSPPSPTLVNQKQQQQQQPLPQQPADQAEVGSSSSVDDFTFEQRSAFFLAVNENQNAKLKELEQQLMMEG